MEKLLTKLATGSAKLEATGSSTSTKASLDKVLNIKGISITHNNYLYAIYLDDRIATIKLKGHLLIVSNDWLEQHDDKQRLKLINGAIEALKTNAYQSVDCYKCNGSGRVNESESDCDRCKGIGSVAKKPKAYQLCGFHRSYWYRKDNTQLREVFDRLVNKLFKLDNEVRAAIAKNERDND
ncbi:hypothetical protein J7384_17120 [Endozoicomonas sp. G2_1]|uniref:hypothetical protein n=1 Tax=Endozoicomonas sp. G2_1 TaxID=2821091 RepID=UPI001ADAA1AF|nr:hypothetical protein [Endozoicomonas sp. G2_1]MBO9492086.1 hypothetical protein [Endozoicomonas sp. G2_1]